MGLVDSIIGAESGGDPNAKNPNSSASGAGQFIDSTWLDTIKSARPDLAAGKSDADILALKTDPDLSRQMTEAYAQQNGQTLTKAGFDPTPGNTYLAHFAGPQGAIKVLSADPNAPVSSVLGDQAVKANPFLNGMTVADLQGWAAKKVGAQASLSPTGQPLGDRPYSEVFPGGRMDPARPLPQSQSLLASLAPPSAPMGKDNSGQVFPGGSLDPNRALPQTDPTTAQVAPSNSLYGQMPADQIAMPTPIFGQQRKPVDISKLRAALQASGNRGLFLNKG